MNAFADGTDGAMMVDSPSSYAYEPPRSSISADTSMRAEAHQRGFAVEAEGAQPDGFYVELAKAPVSVVGVGTTPLAAFHRALDLVAEYEAGKTS